MRKSKINQLFLFQSYTNAFKETQEPGVLDDDDLFAGIEDGGDEDMDSINNLGDIFDGWGDGTPSFLLFFQEFLLQIALFIADAPMPQSSPTGHDRIMDAGLDDNTNRMSVGMDGSSCGQTRNGLEVENVSFLSLFIQTEVINISLTGRTSPSTTPCFGLFSINSSHRPHAILVLVLMSPPRKRLSRLLTYCPPSSLLKYPAK